METDQQTLEERLDVDTVAKEAVLPRYYTLLQTFGKDSKSEVNRKAIQQFAKETHDFSDAYPPEKISFMSMLSFRMAADGLIKWGMDKIDAERVISLGSTILKGLINPKKYADKEGTEYNELYQIWKKKNIPAMLEFLAKYEPTSTKQITEQQYRQMMAPYLK